MSTVISLSTYATVARTSLSRKKGLTRFPCCPNRTPFRLSEPDTVQAVQELTRLAVQNQTGRFSRLILDIGGSRDARQVELARLVDRAVERLDEGATQASLPAMSSYERKLVHDIVAERGLVSESYGEGSDRHTVIRRA